MKHWSAELELFPPLSAAEFAGARRQPPGKRRHSLKGLTLDEMLLPTAGDYVMQQPFSTERIQFWGARVSDFCALASDSGLRETSHRVLETFSVARRLNSRFASDLLNHLDKSIQEMRPIERFLLTQQTVPSVVGRNLVPIDIWKAKAGEIVAELARTGVAPTTTEKQVNHIIAALAKKAADLAARRIKAHVTTRLAAFSHNLDRSSCGQQFLSRVQSGLPFRDLNSTEKRVYDGILSLLLASPGHPLIVYGGTYQLRSRFLFSFATAAQSILRSQLLISGMNFQPVSAAVALPDVLYVRQEHDLAVVKVLWPTLAEAWDILSRAGLVVFSGAWDQISDRRSDLIAFGHRSRVMLVDEFSDDDLRNEHFQNANRVKLTEISYDTIRIQIQTGSDDGNMRPTVQAEGRCRSSSKRDIRDRERGPIVKKNRSRVNRSLHGPR